MKVKELVENLALSLADLRSDFEKSICEHEPILDFQRAFGGSSCYILKCHKCGKILKSYMTKEECLVFQADETAKKVVLANKDASNASKNLHRFFKDQEAHKNKGESSSQV